MIVVLDNLIADSKIHKMAVVFIDQREPGQPSNNRRMTELGLHEAFLAFIADELVPYVEGPSHKQLDSENRGILGTSLGGLSSAFFAFKRPDVFNRVAIQSPAFWYKPEIFALAETPMKQQLSIFLSTGLIYDAGKESARMRDILQQQGHTCRYIEVQEGHSWGNWRNLLDDALIALYGLH
jgi:enterochelin esterase-like enzyme